MEDLQFEHLILRLEKFAQKKPNHYLAAVIGIALLGFVVLSLAVGLSLLALALLLGMVVLVIATGGKALLVLVKLGKLVILLALPAWAMVKTSVTLLFSRFPRPQGRELKLEEAPALFTRIDALRLRMKGPRVHKVLLTNELNASIVQHPRFGLFGWEENYLILGLPLLQTLSEEETFAVVAHEYGHLSGHHSRLGGFIYRFRLAWGRLQYLSEQWDDWGSRLIARLFKWYAPYFNAYTFVLARQNEYIADKSSIEMAGRQNAANALMRINIAAQFKQEEFWPSINRRIENEAEPFGDHSTFWAQSIHTVLDADMRTRFLNVANQRKTDHLDTHPALSDRLAAMGVEIDIEAASILAPPRMNAASAWLGQNCEAITAEFDHTWKMNVAEDWRNRHAYLKERLNRLSVLESQPELNTDEQWERISILDELKPNSDLLTLLNNLLQQLPTHASARFRRGTLLLEKGDESGVVDLESVMQQDDESILAGCEAAWRFYQSSSSDKAEHYAKRWQERSNYLAKIRAELSSLPPDATLAEANLEHSALETIRQILQEHGKHVRTAYIMRRVLKADSSVSDYVLAFETKWFTLGDKGPETIKRLAQQPFPVHIFIVHLGSKPYKRFRKSIKRMKLLSLEPS